MPTRVGDSYTFDVGRTEVPANQTVTVELGYVPEEDYLGILSARVTWTDPVGVPEARAVGVQIGVVAYDSAGQMMADWDSALLMSRDRTYTTDGTARSEDVSMVQPGVIHPPAGYGSLRLEMQYPTGDTSGSIFVEEARVVLTIVTRQV